MFNTTSGNTRLSKPKIKEDQFETIVGELCKQAYPVSGFDDIKRMKEFIHPGLRAFVAHLQSKALCNSVDTSKDEKLLKELLMNAHKIDNLVIFSDIVDLASLYRSKFISDAVLIAEATTKHSMDVMREYLHDLTEIVEEMASRQDLIGLSPKGIHEALKNTPEYSRDPYYKDTLNKFRLISKLQSVVKYKYEVVKDLSHQITNQQIQKEKRWSIQAPFSYSPS